MSAELRVQALRKVFATGKPAVDGVSFTVAPGEIVVLLGPSGCGKTTTLRCVAGLEQPSGGEIGIGGQLVSAPAHGVLVPPRQRNIGMVFQSYAVWPHMTVWKNVAYPLQQRRASGTEIERQVAEALALVGLSDYAQRPVTALSGGQMQRVALARSIVYRPQLLLLDEPLSNLDAKLRLRLRDDLRRIIKQTGITALYVTHDQAEAVVLGDRIGVMRGGRLAQLATADEIYNRPADLFVANFMGASNLLPGRIVERQGEYGVVELAPGSRVTARVPSGLGEGAAVKIALRPENVRCGVNGGTNQFSARVIAHRLEGVHTVYTLAALGSEIEMLELGASVRHPVDSALDIHVPPAACWAYAADEAVEMD
jgi:iron(III) transport system ATP-binding protein